jgi:hypothetical protein
MENCLKTRNFSKWAAKAGISDNALNAAFHEILNGLLYMRLLAAESLRNASLSLDEGKA